MFAAFLFTSVLVEQMAGRAGDFTNIQAFILLTVLKETVIFNVVFIPDSQVISVGLWKSEYE